MVNAATDESPVRTEQGSLRGFIDLVERAGRLVRVQELVHWRHELGRMARAGKSPLLFENIVDYPGQRVFTNGLRDMSLIGLALGLGTRWGRDELIAEARHRAGMPIAPRIVERGPVMENVIEGDAVDLTRFPVPHWNEQDCDRYIGTWHINVTSDPETGARNVGLYRMQLLGPRRATVSTSPGSHLAQHVAKAERAGDPLAMAMAIGVGEATIMAAAAGCPLGVDEFAVAGGFRGWAVDLVRCRASGLEVPADAEIVVEGFIHPNVRVQDGPYFDYTGTVHTNPNAFLFEATRIMHRDGAIFRGTSIGVPGAEDHQLLSILAEIKLLDFHGSNVKKSFQDMVLRERFRKWTQAG
jgi:4-hydroxy-3-polyprenylbenzoate decarboxylase